MDTNQIEHFKFFQNTNCEYFPCHKVVSKENFNCLFCFCPLYMLKDKCGGNYIVNEDIKDCTFCVIPHSKGGYDYIMEKMEDVIRTGSDF